ncbi:MAG: branched-chain amino acid ABC transporter permease [Anaerolineae bacterium]|jgi:branched-chain amino acid transport system permease protein|nr:branched-chain amino acid ABC transporter permease [Anaerolineae bacterium]
MELLAQNLLNGLTIGSFYALVALGYTMVYGVLKLINFAHGGLFMWGAYLGWTFLTILGFLVARTGPFALVPVVILVMITVGLMGVLLERIAYRPLRGTGRLPPVISALGAAFILESAARNLYGASYQVYPTGVDLSGRFNLVGNLTVSYTQVLAVVASLLLMALLYIYVNYTRTGTAMRAVSLDHDTSRLMGIDVNRIIGIVFFIGPALGGAAGVLVALHYGSFNFTLGWTFGLKAFIAAILGGIGNIPGAMLGGLLLGGVESLGAVYLGSQWKDVIAYALLALILIVRPTGILGERVAEKL